MPSSWEISFKKNSRQKGTSRVIIDQFPGYKKGWCKTTFLLVDAFRKSPQHWAWFYLTFQKGGVAWVFIHTPCKVGPEKTVLRCFKYIGAHNSTYRGCNPSSPFKRPFIGVVILFILGGGPPCGKLRLVWLEFFHVLPLKCPASFPLNWLNWLIRCLNWLIYLKKY